MKSPAFRFYPADFMGSPDVAAMDLAEVGSYIFLLCTAWQSERHGYLPDDEGKLRRWARMNHQQWEQSRDILLSKFPIVEPGWRFTPRMAHEAQKQEAYSSAQSMKGRKGGRPKKLEVLKNEAPAFVEKAGVKPSVSEKDKKQLLSFPPGKADETIPQTKRQREKHSYDPRFEMAYQAYPKHEEKAESSLEWEKAISRLRSGEPNLSPMQSGDAADYLLAAVDDYARRKADKETQFVTAMCRWLKRRIYLDFKPRAQVDEVVTTPDGRRVKQSELATDGGSVSAEVA